jgi:hypothetical protein
MRRRARRCSIASSSSLEAFSAATFSALSWRRTTNISISRSAVGVCRCAGRVGMAHPAASLLTEEHCSSGKTMTSNRSFDTSIPPNESIASFVSLPCSCGLVPRQLFGYGRSDRNSKLIRGLRSEAPAGFRSRRGCGHDPTPVTSHNAPFASYKAPRVHHAARRRGGRLAAGARAQQAVMQVIGFISGRMCSPAPDHPLMQMRGRSCATRRAKPACSAAATTAPTSL